MALGFGSWTKAQSLTPTGFYRNLTARNQEGQAMLNLQRKLGERIVARIGDTEIRICATQLHGKRVVFGIEAPKHVLILRKEIADKMDAEQEDEKQAV